MNFVKNNYPRLKQYYYDKIINNFISNYKLKNPMQAPRLMKILISTGLGEAVKNTQILKTNRDCIEKICGQKSITMKAKKSISSFKLRSGMDIGLKITLRRNRMWEFLDRFINIALPRVRDFRGIHSNFDGSGNCTIGIKEQIIFPEIDYVQASGIKGMNITIVTSSNKDIYGKFLLSQLGMPFKH